LVSCLFLEDFPEVLSIADVRRRGEKYRAATRREIPRGGVAGSRFALWRGVVAWRSLKHAEFC